MNLYKPLLFLALAAISLHAEAQKTDAYIKLFDRHGKHPRIESITFPGNANNIDMYNSIYGHGAVIENPWVAYRVYMDNRQSLDLYVKQKPQLELDVTGFYTTPEQMKQGYGCDVLWAGKSVAAGSFRGWDGTRPTTIDSVTSRTQTVLDNHSVLVTDKQWRYHGKDIEMNQIYRVDGESRALDVEIELANYSPDDIFCTGVQKLESDNIGFVRPEGYAASWGNNIPDKNHPELVERVGLGIIVAPENIAGTVEDDLNYLILLRPSKDGKIRYRVYATGSREVGATSSFDQWTAYIESAFKNIAQ